MNNGQIVEWKDKLMPALKSKQVEFEVMGYKDISTSDIWECLLKRTWKSNKELSLHQAVQDVLHLPIQTYMSYLTLSAYDIDNDDLMMSIKAVINNNES